MFAPPSYLSGCSQAVWRTPGREHRSSCGTTTTPRSGSRARSSPRPGRAERVIGVSDCAWGLLDGINEDGLAVSLAFGGRKVVGTGFGVPLVVRYLLQTCGSTTEARRSVLRRLPYHLAHTLTIVDVTGDTCTAYSLPTARSCSPRCAVATNHQGQIEWTEHARATFSLEREGASVGLVTGGVSSSPSRRARVPDPAALPGRLRAANGDALHRGLRRSAGAATYCWPGLAWEQSFAEFGPGVQTVDGREPGRCLKRLE